MSPEKENVNQQSVDWFFDVSYEISVALRRVCVCEYTTGRYGLPDGRRAEQYDHFISMSIEFLMLVCFQCGLAHKVV